MSDETKKDFKTLKIIGTAILWMALTAGFCFMMFWQNDAQIERALQNHESQISKAILSTVKQQAKLDIFMPQIVLIETDSIQKKHLKDSISNKIASVITDRYLLNGQKPIHPDSLGFQPFFVFPEADKEGNYALSPQQMAELKNHIQFLTAQVDKAIEAAKDEMNRETSLTATIISIWIGALAVFGTILPLFYNYKSTETLREVKHKAESAHSLLEKHKGNLEKVEEVDSELKNIKTNYDQLNAQITKATEDSTAASTKATDALTKTDKVESLIMVVNDVGKIKDIDATLLLYQSEPFRVLSGYLSEIRDNLRNCEEIAGEKVVKDALRQLALRLHIIAPMKFISAEHFLLLNNFSLELSRAVKAGITQDSFADIMASFDEFLTNLSEVENV